MSESNTLANLNGLLSLSKVIKIKNKKMVFIIGDPIKSLEELEVGQWYILEISGTEHVHKYPTKYVKHVENTYGFYDIIADKVLYYDVAMFKYYVVKSVIVLSYDS